MDVSTNISTNYVLTEDDVLRLIHDKSADGRAEITSKIAISYTNTSLTDKERKIAEQIFRLLVRDTELKVRASLADNLKESTTIPRDIVQTMANDVEQVSLPILEYSQVLTDKDLLEIIHSADTDSSPDSENTKYDKYIAISRRKTVSEAVSDKLLEKGNEDVASSLINNYGARIADESLEKIIENSKGNASLIDAMTTRPRLSVSIAEKLVNIVSTNLAEALKKKYNAPDNTISKELDKETEKTRESETLGLVRVARSHDDVVSLIDQLKTSDRLTPSMILSALCQGNFDFFESSLAMLSNISVENARTLIADRGELGFRAIYNKSGLPDAMFPAVKLLLKIVREMDNGGLEAGTSRYANRVVENILQYAETNPVENISYIIALVRKVAQER